MKKRITKTFYLSPKVVSVVEIESEVAICESSPVISKNNTIDIEKQNQGQDFSFNLN